MSRNALLGVDTGVGCSEDKCNALLPMVNVKPIVYIALQEVEIGNRGNILQHKRQIKLNLGNFTVQHNSCF